MARINMSSKEYKKLTEAAEATTPPEESSGFGAGLITGIILSAIVCFIL